MKNKKNIITSVVILSLAVVSVLAWNYFGQLNRQQDAANNPVTDNIVLDTSQELTDGQPGGEDKIITPTTTDTDSDTSPEKPTLTRAEVSGDYIRVSATFSQPSNGECVVIFEKDGASSLSKTSAIIVGPSYYTCNGFRVARSEFAQSGQWKVRVSHKHNDRESSSEERIIEIQ